MNVTKQHREALLSRLLDAGDAGIPWGRLTGRGIYTATKLCTLGYARRDESTWTLHITERGAERFAKGKG